MQSVTTVPATTVLSEALIPAVRGEFYDYDHEFTAERPVFVLLKCKSNKARPMAQLSDLGNEANILFCFVARDRVVALSIDYVNGAGMLEQQFEASFFGTTHLGKVDITAQEFHAIRNKQNVDELVTTCRAACSGQATHVVLKEGDVFAALTDAGKYGMFLVHSIEPDSVLLNACHILL